jgi:hypothetical protein
MAAQAFRLSENKKNIEDKSMVLFVIITLYVIARKERSE